MSFKGLAVFLLLIALNLTTISSAPLPQIFATSDTRIEVSYSLSDPESNPDLIVSDEDQPIIIYQSYSDENGLLSEVDDQPLDKEFTLNFPGGAEDKNDDIIEGPTLVLVNENENESITRMRYISVNLIRIFLVLGLIAFLISFVSVLSCCVFCLLFRPNGGLGSTYIWYDELPNSRATGQRDLVYNYTYDEALLQNFVRPQHDLPPKYADLTFSQSHKVVGAEVPPPSYTPNLDSATHQGQ